MLNVSYTFFSVSQGCYKPEFELGIAGVMLFKKYLKQWLNFQNDY